MRDQLNTQLREKDDHIRELRRRLEAADVETQLSRFTQLQLLPQTNSWNVPRSEVHLSEQIGYGAAGLVSKGHFQGQVVAVKQIHREILREKHIMDEFKREAGIMATIQHPNLVRFIAAVFDERVEQLRDTLLFVLELLHTNLRDAYKDYDFSAKFKVLPIFCDVAYGLYYLHEHNEPIVHRDVSAPNILLEALPDETWRAISFLILAQQISSDVLRPSESEQLSTQLLRCFPERDPVLQCHAQQPSPMCSVQDCSC